MNKQTEIFGPGETYLGATSCDCDDDCPFAMATLLAGYSIKQTPGTKHITRVHSGLTTPIPNMHAICANCGNKRTTR